MSRSNHTASTNNNDAPDGSAIIHLPRATAPGQTPADTTPFVAQAILAMQQQDPTFAATVRINPNPGANGRHAITIVSNAQDNGVVVSSSVTTQR